MTRKLWLSLLVLALVSLAGILVVSLTDEKDSDLGAGSLLLPGFAERVDDLYEVHMVFPGGEEVSDSDTGSGVGTVQITLWNDGRRWRLREHHDYFADVATLSEMVYALSELRLQEAKTAVRDKHERLGLGAPAEGGSAVQLSLYDGQGAAMAEVLLGDEAVSRSGRYVRHLGEDQTWLANAVVERLSDDVNTWLQRPLLNISGDEVSSVTFTNYVEDEGSYSLRRPSGFSFLSIVPPEGYKVTDPRSLNDWGRVLQDLDYDDVLPYPEGVSPQDLDFDLERRVDVNLYQGATVRVEIGRADLSDALLMRLFFFVSDPAAADEDALSMVDTYSEYYQPWLYEINDGVETRFIFDPDLVFSEVEEEASADSGG